ncbi:hypothetical protein NVP1275O_19 [Vibrio phage 1.275.O._10N.286.54.E11]|nr:hypothetical protein NVP1275O_19 [Vibrio phage 1.275.O._10N.286.54.E11]
MDLKIVNKEKLLSGDERHPIQIMNDNGVSYTQYKVEPCGVWIFLSCDKKPDLDYINEV